MKETQQIRGPSSQQRTIILGRTGAGKSQFAWSLMSTRNFDNMPWTIIDYKREDLIEETVDATNGAIKDIKVTDKPPKKPGLYRLLVRPQMDDDAVNQYLWNVYKNKNHGLLIDEGFALPQDRNCPFDIILTQGRSLYIPVIALYQRPVYMSRFAIAQADFFAVFEQNDLRDLKQTAQYVRPATGSNGEAISVFSRLPRYHCLWYDVANAQSNVLRPAPNKDDIIKTFIDRLKAKTARTLI